MTTANTLEARQAKLAQRKARLAEEEAKIAEAARKAENRRKYELGGLAMKAGLGGFDNNALLGGFLAIADASPEQLATWVKRGGVALNAEKAAGAPVVLRFAGEPAADVRKALRASGLRWNKVLRHWEGVVDPVRAQALAKSANGTMEEIGAHAIAAE